MQYYKAEQFRHKQLENHPCLCYSIYSDGVSPSGKATGSGPVMRGFESLHPSHIAFFVCRGRLFFITTTTIREHDKTTNLLLHSLSLVQLITLWRISPVICRN